MNKFRGKLALLLSLLLAFGVFAGGCDLIQKTTEAISKQNVAKVGSEYITRSQLDEMFGFYKESIKAQGQYDDKYFASTEGKQYLSTLKRQLLDTMVEQKVIEQKVTELKLFKNQDEIKTEITKVIDTQVKAGKTDADFKTWLEQAKLTTSLLDKLVRQQVLSDKLYENSVTDVTITDDEVQKYYDANKTTFTEKPDTMEVSHILLKTEEEAKAIKARLDKGEDFATIAKASSIEPAAKESGGSLGEIKYNDPNYDSTFVAAAMALKQGETSSPVQTKFGYHIIRVTKKTEYPILAFDKVKDEIKPQLLEQKKQTKYTDLLKQWKDKSGIKLYDKNIDN